VSEVVALEQQRFVEGNGERVSEGVAIVEVRRVPAPTAEVAVGGPGDPRLFLRHGLEDDAEDVEQLVEAPCCDRVATAVDDGAGLDVAGGR
jgi:hypothetical protein